MRLVHTGESSAASDSLTGSAAQAGERLLQAGAGLGISLYAGGLVLGAVDLATLVGLDRAIVLHVQVVFVIMTATTLMTATIKLRQNLASL